MGRSRARGVASAKLGRFSLSSSSGVGANALARADADVAISAARVVPVMTTTGTASQPPTGVPCRSWSVIRDPRARNASSSSTRARDASGRRCAPFARTTLGVVQNARASCVRHQRAPRRVVRESVLEARPRPRRRSKRYFLLNGRVMIRLAIRPHFCAVRGTPAPSRRGNRTSLAVGYRDSRLRAMRRTRRLQTTKCTTPLPEDRSRVALLRSPSDESDPFSNHSAGSSPSAALISAFVALGLFGSTQCPTDSCRRNTLAMKSRVSLRLYSPLGSSTPRTPSVAAGRR